MGEIVGEQVRWAQVAWSEEPPMDRVKMLEEMFRTLRQNGKAHPNINHGVVESQFSELPTALKETLSNTMQFGVRTGIPTPEKTTQAKESKTARDNRETVWKHLRKFVANGWLRAFPPSSA